jgi:hypothetical protein
MATCSCAEHPKLEKPTHRWSLCLLVAPRPFNQKMAVQGSDNPERGVCEEKLNGHNDTFNRWEGITC